MENNYVALSVVMITCNAAKSLRLSLQTVVALTDDIVVVDSGSTDDTIAIASEFGANVIHQHWLGFGPQKQIAVALAKHDWVLCLDADEWLSDTLIQSIRSVLTQPACYAYTMPRANRFLGRLLKHGEAYPDENLRLFHRQYAYWSNDMVHEKVVTSHHQPIGKLTGDLLHDSAESLEVYLEKQNRYTSLQAQEIVESGKKISVAKAIGSAVFRFIKGYVFRLGFLDGFAGFVHILIASSNSFFKYTKAIAEQKKTRQLDVAQKK